MAFLQGNDKDGNGTPDWLDAIRDITNPKVDTNVKADKSMFYLLGGFILSLFVIIFTFKK